MPDVLLSGCLPEPLGGYLAALGVFRLVAEQVDRNATGRWTPSGFVVSSTLDEESLVDFLTESYRPSPLLAAWNGGGGLFMRQGSPDPVTKEPRFDKPTTMTRATEAVRVSKAGRLEAYRRFIEQCRAVLEGLGLKTTPKDDQKHALLSALRNTVDDETLDWLDAVVSIGEDDSKFPPLLGTGGNDGALDFANNFQQRLADLMDFDSGAPSKQSRNWLRAVLYDRPTPGLQSASVGQFDPGAVGGNNATQGFDAGSLVNPWSFVLFMEGTLVMAAAATRRLESGTPGALSFPFTVRSTGAGGGSTSEADEASSRNEIWLPLWRRDASYREVRRLFAEGRATVGRRVARDGVDFARAVGTLGVDRGVDAFLRYGFHKRNGLAYLATPLGYWPVRRRPELDLIDSALDRWLDTFRRVATSEHATASVRAARSQLDRAILAMARQPEPEHIQGVLLALANAERVLARSPALREQIRTPVPALVARWEELAHDGSIEFRLAAALAEAGIRGRIVPVQGSRWSPPNDRSTVWGGGPLVDNLVRVLQREEVELGETTAKRHRAADGVSPDDVRAFIDGQVDDLRIGELAHALSLVSGIRGRPVDAKGRISLMWALLALAWDQRHPAVRNSEVLRPALRVVGMISAGARGDGWRATEVACRRLAASELRHRIVDPPKGEVTSRLSVRPQADTAVRTRRATAALAFAISDRTLEKLAQLVFTVHSDHHEVSA